jgi:hypothetical protein
MAYNVGDIVFWRIDSTAGEGVFIGEPRNDKHGKILILAGPTELGLEFDAGPVAPRGEAIHGRDRNTACDMPETSPASCWGIPRSASNGAFRQSAGSWEWLARLIRRRVLDRAPIRSGCEESLVSLISAAAPILAAIAQFCERYSIDPVTGS